MSLPERSVAGSLVPSGLLKLAGVAMLAAAAGAAQGQAADSAPLPYDWSHRHVVFSDPGGGAAADKALGAQTTRAISDEPRYEFQVRRRALAAAAPDAFAQSAATAAGRPARPAAAAPDRAKKRRTEAIHRDWSNVMGGASGSGSGGTFPAKFAFGTASASCAADFVVFTTASAGATGSGALATRDGSFSANANAGDTVTITNGTRTLTLTASTSVNTGLNFQNGSAATSAANLALAIARNGGTVGVTATNPSSGTVRVTAITPGTGANSIALADNNSRFAWAATTLGGGTGTAGQPTIFALNQLYSSCGSATQAVPQTFWSYNTGTGAVAQTSPVLSINGDQVAFVQSTSAGVANLVLLKWSSSASVGTIGAPTAPASVTLAQYRTCTTPCMTVIPFSGNPNDTNSSPFYDYANDNLYIGADNGTLHKFTAVFNGTPAEQTTGGFPATVSTGNILSSPVYDSVSGLVFVGSAAGASTGGQLHSVSAAGAVLSSARIATLSSLGVSDAPLVDSAAHRVYAFVGSDDTGDCPANPLGAQCAAIYQFATSSSLSGSSGTRVTVGRGSITANKVLYAGTFDAGYYASSASSPTGNLYVCGAQSGASFQYTLWKIPITGNVMGTPVIGPALTSDQLTFAPVQCSPVTEVQNGANDYIYVSIPVTGTANGCSGTAGAAGCIYAYNLTGATWNAALAATAGLPASGGTGGIVIDNTSSTTGASQIYFSTNTAPGNAVQASQGGLN